MKNCIDVTEYKGTNHESIIRFIRDDYNKLRVQVIKGNEVVIPFNKLIDLRESGYCDNPVELKYFIEDGELPSGVFEQMMKEAQTTDNG